MLDINFSPFPVLSTERLTLRQLNNRDIPQLFSLRSDERVMEFVDRPLAKSEEEIADLIILINKSMQNNEAITWSVTLKDDTKLIGTIGFWKITKEHYRAEIGYLLNADYQGKGIMNEALTEVLKFGFQTIRLPSVEANVNPKNAASIKLLIKNGFNREAYFRENYYFNGQFLDSEIYSLINPES